MLLQLPQKTSNRRNVGYTSAQTPLMVITGRTPLQLFYTSLPIASCLIISSYHQPGPVSPRLQINVISLKKHLNLATLPPINMSVDAAPSDLTKVDSAISGLSSSPTDEKGPVKGHRRASSSAAGVYNIADLGKPSRGCCSWKSSFEHGADK